MDKCRYLEKCNFLFKKETKFYGYGAKAVVILTLFRVIGETLLALAG